MCRCNLSQRHDLFQDTNGQRSVEAGIEQSGGSKKQWPICEMEHVPGKKRGLVEAAHNGEDRAPVIKIEQFAARRLLVRCGARARTGDHLHPVGVAIEKDEGQVERCMRRVESDKHGQ